MNEFCTKTWKDVVETLDTDIYKGLSDVEVVKRKSKEKHTNEKIYNKKVRKDIIKEFTKIYLIISLVTIIYLIILKQYALSIIGLTILGINVVTKIYYLISVKKKNKVLDDLNKASTTVLRNSRERVVRSDELVVGDIVVFREGGLVAGDIRVIEGKNLKVNENNVTGEDFAKDKFENKLEGKYINVNEMKNMLFRGSVIEKGSGYGVVVATGEDTILGDTISKLKYQNTNKNSLLKKLEKSFSIFEIVILVVSILSFVVTKNKSLFISLLSIFISIPFNLMVLLASILYKNKLKSEGISISNFSSLDSLKNIKSIFFDKVGAVSEEEYNVQKLYVSQRVYIKRLIKYNDDESIQKMLDIMLLNNNSNISDDGVISGDIKDKAYISFTEGIVRKNDLEVLHPKVLEIPMDSDKRVFSTINKYKRGYRANVRGNVDSILERCTQILINGAERAITRDDIQRMKDVDYNYSLEGLITEGVAYRNFNYMPSEDENIESNLVFAGIVALDNPICKDAINNLEEIKDNDIILAMFTEDNKIMAMVKGKELRLVDGINGVVSGIELTAFNEKEYNLLVNKVRVYSRLSFEDKSKVINLFNKHKLNVAYFGEVLGDLPSIAASTIAVAKEKATDFIKKISDIQIKGNTLEGFIKLFDIAEKLKNKIKNNFSIVFTLMLAEIIVLAYSSIKESININHFIMCIINSVMLLPTLIIKTVTKEEEYEMKKYITRGVLWSVIPIICMYGLKNGQDMITFSSLSLLIILFTIISSKLKVLLKNKKLLLFLLFMMIVFLSTTAVLYFDNVVKLNILDISKIAISFIVYIAVELNMRSWQK